MDCKHQCIHYSKADGKHYCMDCDILIPEAKDLDDLTWDDLFTHSAKHNVVKCECGSEALGSDRHSTWCPKYKN